MNVLHRVEYVDEAGVPHLVAHVEDTGWRGSHSLYRIVSLVRDGTPPPEVLVTVEMTLCPMDGAGYLLTVQVGVGEGPLSAVLIASEGNLGKALLAAESAAARHLENSGLHVTIPRYAPRDDMAKAVRAYLRLEDDPEGAYLEGLYDAAVEGAVEIYHNNRGEGP